MSYPNEAIGAMAEAATKYYDLNVEELIVIKHKVQVALEQADWSKDIAVDISEVFVSGLLNRTQSTEQFNLRFSNELDRGDK